MKIFLSAVSAQFKACRDELASDLRAIGCEVRIQEDFQQGPRTLIDRLEEYVDQCDRVIALVGDAYGFEAAGVAVPTVDPPRSYTQWEYAFTMGERLDGSRAARKDLYLYFASNDFLRTHQVDEPKEQAERQRLFCEQVKATGEHWSAFDTANQLCRQVLRDGWKMEHRPTIKPRNLPSDSIGTLFKGREEFLATLHERLNDGSRASVVSTVHGLGGVGKTRLAIEYALRHVSEYSALLFVTADTPEAFRRNLAALCGQLVLDLDEKDAKEENARVAAALSWLREHPGWLLIIDNVDSPAAVVEVERALAQIVGGHILVTSRITEWSAGIATLELDVLATDAAVAFLLERTGGRRQATTTDQTDARTLANEVDGLALALEQSGAFISKLRISFAEYLRRWRVRESKVREWYDERLMKYPRSVAVTWDTSFEQLGPASRGLLDVLCWFSPEPVPRTVFDTAVASETVRSIPERLATEQKVADLEDAVSELASLSLLKWEQANNAFRMHRLVAEITRERASEETREKSLRAATVIINAWLPDDPPPQDVRSWNRWNPIRPHAVAIVAAADAEGLDALTRTLIRALGCYLSAQGVWGDAERLLRRALVIEERSYGLNHPNVAWVLNNLAELLASTNRFAEAEPLLRRALAIDEQISGPDHPNVSRDLSNLAAQLYLTNRLAEAEPLMRRALVIDEKSFGPDDARVGRGLSNLGALLAATSRLAEAEPLFRRALVIDEKAYGPAHPSVAIRLNNLAAHLQDTNRLAEAEPLMRRALLIDEQSYGPEHPDVAIRLNNLALLLENTSRLKEAEALMRRALAIDEERYGPDHPSLARGLSNLAMLLARTNRLAEAEHLMRRSLLINENSYDPNNPDIAISLNNLALLLRFTNRFPEAVPLVRRSLAILLTFAATTGHPHPGQGQVVNNYAGMLEQMGHTDEEVHAKLDEVGRPFGVQLGR